VTSVYAFKAKPDALVSDDGEEEDEDIETETHVERVALRGNGVTRSDIFNDLLDEDDYYITKMAWEAREVGGAGHAYAIEAMFANPKDCTGFSFILIGVYPCEEGLLSNRRRAPFKHEIEKISSVVEARARELVKQLSDEFAGPTGDGDAA